jgi:pimeloyl-ACP methyl ester carboxylesterase
VVSFVQGTRGFRIRRLNLATQEVRMPRAHWDEHVRFESSADGLPPLLVIQAGPGLPLLNERRRYGKLLALEDHFTVFYWDRSGTGLNAPPAGGLRLDAHLEETVTLLERIALTSGQTVTVMGVSIGGTLALLARQLLPELVDRVVAISPDLDTTVADWHAHERILAAVHEPRWQWLAPRAARLQPPPCLDPAQFRLRATLLGHLGGLEARVSYGTQIRRMVLGIAGTYGPHRLPRVLANMNASTRALLPQLAKVDLISRWPRSPVPADLLFGDADLLSPAAMVDRVRPMLGPQDTLRVVHGAAHMAHFDAPEVVRAIILGEKRSGSSVPTQNAATHLGIA